MEIKRLRGKIIKKCKTLPSSSTTSSPKDSLRFINNNNNEFQYISNNISNINGIYSKPKEVHRPVRKIRSVANLTSIEDLDIELEGTSRIIPIYHHQDEYKNKERLKLRNKSCDNAQYISLPIQDSIIIKDNQSDSTINELNVRIKTLEKENQRLKSINIEIKTKLSNKEIEENARLNSEKYNNSNYTTSNKDLVKLNQENQELKLQIKQLQIKLKDKETKYNYTNRNKLKNLFVKNEIKSFFIQGNKISKMKHNNNNNSTIENEYKNLAKKYNFLEKEKDQLKITILQYKKQSNVIKPKSKSNYNSKPNKEKTKEKEKEKKEEECIDLWNDDKDVNDKKSQDELFKNKNEEEETRDSNWVNSQYKDKDKEYNLNGKELDFFEDGEDYYMETENEKETKIETKRDLDKKSLIMELMSDSTFGLCWNPNKKVNSTNNLNQKENKMSSNNSICSIKPKAYK